MANRIHMTKKPSLDLTRKYDINKYINKYPFKPNGLWYSIDNEWYEWCAGEMPDWIKGWSYSLEIDTANVLIISTTFQLNKFLEKYQEKTTQYIYSIDWYKVSRDYTGIEIQRYHHLKYMCDRNIDGFSKLVWLYGWDVSGGCIWDMSVIEKVKRYATHS
ncbi:MAG TPA: hypothetical protein VMW20_00500 [Candidatus Nanoarchaeia archaeon]|nr:hypothetical protein [Candidatus Nanoarchaeia archaeon]